MSNLLALLGRLTTVRIDKFAESGKLLETDDDRVPASITDGANCVSSRVTGMAGGPYHLIVLDLDIPAYLVPSSTPGHSHLYIDKVLPEASYYALLDALSDAGVLEPGYVSASKRKGGTHLRLPWIKKGAPAPSPAPTAALPF